MFVQPFTGDGVWSCTHGNFFINQKWSWLNCLLFRIYTVKGGKNDNLFDSHDNNLEWYITSRSCNILDLTVNIPKEQCGEDISHFYISLLGRPPHTNLVFDNMALKRLEEANHTIFNTTKYTRDVVNCSNDILFNIYGKYQSPSMWNSQGN